METIVPDSVRYRMDKAHGHETFAQIFTMGGLRSVGDLLVCAKIEKLGIVDPTTVQGGVRRSSPKTRAHSSKDQLATWSAITAEGYLRWFNDFRAGGATVHRPAPTRLEQS